MALSEQCQELKDRRIAERAKRVAAKSVIDTLVSNKETLIASRIAARTALNAIDESIAALNTNLKNERGKRDDAVAELAAIKAEWDEAGC